MSQELEEVRLSHLESNPFFSLFFSLSSPHTCSTGSSSTPFHTSFPSFPHPIPRQNILGRRHRKHKDSVTGTIWACVSNIRETSVDRGASQGDRQVVWGLQGLGGFRILLLMCWKDLVQRCNKLWLRFQRDPSVAQWGDEGGG